MPLAPYSAFDSYRRPWILVALVWLLAMFATNASAATVARPEPEIQKPLSKTLSGPQSGPMSVIVGIEPDQTSCFAGGANGRGFSKAEELSPGLRDGDAYTLYDLTGRRGEVVAVGVPRNEGSDGECSELWRQELSLDPGDKGRPVVALRLPDGSADPLPKTLEILPEPLAEHRELVRDFLSKRDVSNPQPAIIQTIRTDLDGDGTPEYILNAVRIDPEQARAGDHSIILVVRGEAKRSRTFIIQDEVDVDGGEFSSTLWTNTIVAVVDVDGDGIAEIITEGGFVYGGGWDVIRFDGAGFEYMLFCGCEG